MNERIKELIQKAQKVVGHTDGGYTEIKVLDPEKFAELLIRECVNIYSKIDNGNLHMGTDNYLEALHKTFRS